MILSYRDLKVWRQSMDLAEAAYLVTANLPTAEKFGLSAQIRNAAASVPANIAEGYGRESSRSYIQFLKTARGLLKELETLILLAQRVGFLSRRQIEPLLDRSDGIGRMLNALIKSIRASAEPAITR